MVKGMHLTPIGGGVVLLEPKEGLDPSAPDEYIEQMIEYLQRVHACRVVYDLKHTPIIEKVYYNWLARIEAALRICGIELVVVDMRPAAAFALAQWLDEPPVFKCSPDVNSARLGPIEKEKV